MNQRPSPKQLAEAHALIRADKKARKANRPKVKHGRVRVRRERDQGYLGWLHEGLPCIACLVLGEPPAGSAPIEAAHQKVNAPSRGIFKRMGVRPSDWLCCPLCVSHHREGPLRCDPAQTKFWCEVGLEPEQVADFCAELYRAYERDGDGTAVVREFAAIAAGQRADNDIIGRGM